MLLFPSSSFYLRTESTIWAGGGMELTKFGFSGQVDVRKNGINKKGA
jgi:hypothetical protein